MYSFKTASALVFSAALIASTSVMAHPVTSGAGSHSNTAGAHGPIHSSSLGGGHSSTSGAHGSTHTSGVTKPGSSH
jgi:hypothetical protein